MRDIRPAFLKYRQDHGSYPESLTGLVPDYLDGIPPQLVNNGGEDQYRMISYVLQDGRPVFHYRIMRGPDSSAQYDLQDDAFRYDE
jgi:hypothetical protein